MRHRFSPNGVISLGMIRLENYTTRLGYFILLKCPKEAFHEFNAVCRNVLAGQLDDLCAGDCTRLAEMVNVPAAAIRRCRLQGYDLTNQGRRCRSFLAGFRRLDPCQVRGTYSFRLCIAERARDGHSRRRYA
jgi:hypothetical protein